MLLLVSALTVVVYDIIVSFGQEARLTLTLYEIR